MLTNTFRDTVVTNKLLAIEEEEHGRMHLSITQNDKIKFLDGTKKNVFMVENINELMMESTAPRVFEDIFIKPVTARQSICQIPGRPVFILVHGFQATRRDF